MTNRTVEEGLPYPLGAHWDGNGTNFALFSANATKVEVCLFDGDTETRIELPEYTDEVFHGYIPDVAPGTFYGYRVHGPYEPENGHRFNPNKLLLDPYARAHAGTLEWNPAVFGYKMETGDDTTFDERDSAPFMPKCVVVDKNFDWTGEAGRLPVPWDQTIIYEVHVKGFTKQHPDVPETIRGTYAGFGSKPAVDYLKDLGITSVELLPIHTFINDDYLLDKKLVNYWGYNTIGFFAPDPRYASDVPNSLREFKEMVSALHAGGLEVILDVVYNHTAEGNELGPTLSFKGIDNASYYRLLPDKKRHYINDTGTGNTVNLSHARVIQMVADSLRYWVREMHIDGFRFDLGTILAREVYGFDEQSGFLKAVDQDPLLTTVKLIAEPWDIGPGGYQVGGFPPGWAEWNDKFRDTMRDFWRGEAPVAAIAPRLSASADLFNHQGRRAWSCVNFVTAHDGFTLNDWASYNEKHNEANGEDNKDGSSNNASWNCGVEGPTDDKAITALRERQKRNMLATLLFSQGTPMLLGGDEFGRTQHGNNNAYCQDSEISWFNWELTDDGKDLLKFTKRLIDLQRTCAILRRSRFLTGQHDPHLDVRDVTWINANGSEMQDSNWQDTNIKCFGMLLDGRAQKTGIRRLGEDQTVLMVMNGYEDVVDFTMPKAFGGSQWTLLIDTNIPDTDGGTDFPFGDVYQVTGRSLLLLALKK
ncbi:glycogen debranching protein GlgX [Rhodopseudomonas sp. P2A-2r]|uniref:glycogen debranching protein GlgX n=1 Tax=unclassified Rhodopseudomonas TaxID=2638247 RepID=UPI002234A3E7|nr:glycogen debranching protein GlgX [Rhodopseudomonas sp. P2A-2r]UZE48681.1 glycogen debranching protein GlgX [Rhodopseudomonas sp. P2A-2r]